MTCERLSTKGKKDIRDESETVDRLVREHSLPGEPIQIVRTLLQHSCRFKKLVGNLNKTRSELRKALKTPDETLKMDLGKASDQARLYSIDEKERQLIGSLGEKVSKFQELTLAMEENKKAEDENSQKKKANSEDLAAIEIPGIGPEIAESIHAYFQDTRNLALLAKLRKAGVQMHRDGPEQTDPGVLPLSGKTFVVTGTLSAFGRREAETRIKALGGGVTSSVSVKTNYLVAGESAGSKLNAAIKLNTPVLDEVAFLALLEDPASARDVSSLPEESTSTV